MYQHYVEKDYATIDALMAYETCCHSELKSTVLNFNLYGKTTGPKAGPATCSHVYLE